AVFMVEIFGQVLSAMMQRDMAFNKMAATGIASQVVGGACTIVLGALGFSYMSFAWGWLTGTLVGVFAAASLRRGLRVFLPSLQGWRPMLAFGGYHGVTFMLQRAYEQLPYLVLGHLLSMDAAGLYNRALNLSQLPQKIVLGGVFGLMFPVLSSQVRTGR